MQRPRWHRLGSVVLLAAVLGTGCTADDPEPTAQTEATPPVEDADVEAPDASHASHDEDGADDGTDDDVAAGAGLFQGSTMCVADGPDHEDCLSPDGHPAGVCTAEWHPDAEELLAADGELTYELRYDGQEVLAGSISHAELRDVAGLLSEPLELRYSLGGLPFAAGSYECRIDDGHAVIDEQVVVTDGPTDPIYGIAVCDLDETVQAGGSRVCVDDVEEFVDVTHLNCSVAVAGLGDADLRGEFIWSPPEDTELFTEQRVHMDVSQTGLALHAFNLYADASAFGNPVERRSPGDAIAAGDYTCRFSDRGTDQTLAETSFTVAE